MNKLVKPKLEVFAQCFDGKVNFGDIDGWVEWNGAFCILEWKSMWGRLLDSQAIALMTFSRREGCIAFIAAGDAQTMECSEYAIVWKENYKWYAGDSDQLFARIRAWRRWAERYGPGHPFYDPRGLCDHIPLVPPVPQIAASAPVAPVQRGKQFELPL
jgi:hypothetical protein